MLKKLKPETNAARGGSESARFFSKLRTIANKFFFAKKMARESPKCSIQRLIAVI
jgi:hypothetical protein